MKLIIGGAYQGKRAFAMEKLGIPETQIFTCEDTHIDFSKPCIENGVEKYLVIIGTDDANRNVLALTNIKLNGYTILGGGTAAAELTVLQDVSDINASHMAAETYGLIKRYVAKNN